MNKQPELPDLMRDMEIQQSLRRMGKRAKPDAASGPDKSLSPSQ